MIPLNIISRIFRHLVVLITTTFPYCNRPAAQVSIVNLTTDIVVPKIDLGNTERYVTIQMDIQGGNKPAFTFTDLPYDKSKGLLLMKDDGIITDYTIVYKILNGGVVNGKKYPGFTYTDGTGKKIGYKYSFAINANDEHSNSPNATTWAQMIEMVSKGHAIMNHSIFHGGTDKLKAIKDAEKNLWLHTHYRMTEFVPPGNEEGFVASGIQLGYHMFSSEFSEPIPDGNNDPGNQNMTWGSYIPMLRQDFNKVLVSRTNLGDQWNTKELPNAKSFVDFIFNNPKKAEKLVGTAFSHGPFADHKESADIFFQFMMYIKNHPNNRDSAWITSSKELMDYEKTKAKVIITSQDFNKQTGKFKIVLDMNNIDPNVMYRNLSMKVKGGKFSNVTATGVNDITFNPNTGLINIYKTDRSKVRNPFSDVLPPQILSIKAQGTAVTITYDKEVNQTIKQAYEVTGNIVNSLKGNGKIWQLIMKNPVSSSQLFYYRMQRGDAKQKGNPSLCVCSYTGATITH